VAVTYARRLPRRRAALDYWRGAFTAASALAVLVMVAWAVANSRPVAIPSDSSAVGQQVPFGPVTLSPQRNLGSTAPRCARGFGFGRSHLRGSAQTAGNAAKSNALCSRQCRGG